MAGWPTFFLAALCASNTFAKPWNQTTSINSTNSKDAIPPTALYKNPSAPIEARISDLLRRMTIQEKTSQLLQSGLDTWMDPKTGTLNTSALPNALGPRASQFYVGYPLPVAKLSAGIKAGQNYLVHETRLGIPAFVQTEAIHGFLALNATIFNSPIAHACSWNVDLVKRMARVIADEARAVGVNMLFAPLADLARELRYGRVEETYGEDGFLTGEIAHAYVVGLQSGNVSAQVKHFAAFSAPEQGLNTGPVHGGERERRTTWLPPFKRAIIDAGAHSVMGAYHAYDGVPAVADEALLTGVLREEWGYEGYVISDAGATDRLCAVFKMCREKPIDKQAVVRLALEAGTDVEMGGGSFSYEEIPRMVERGELDEGIVDRAVERVLWSKFKSGLFERPFVGAEVEEIGKAIRTEEALKLARELDAESLVLLENKNGVLPLKSDANVAVIGPMAHGYMNYGDYVIEGAQWHGVTPLDGIKAASTGKITYAKGCERWSNDESGFPEAVQAAKSADISVVVVGTWSRDQTELWSGGNATTGEHVDISSLKLFGAMGSLVKAIIDTGKPTIVVFSSGKPVTEPWISKKAAGLIQQFYPSEEGGNALADVLYGKVNPSGKLSVSIPHDVGTTPIFYDYLNSGRLAKSGEVKADGSVQFGYQYVDNTPEALYEFGYGKSYSNFTYSGLRLSSKTATVKDTITVSVTIKNTGSRDGAEVVQLYVEDLIASVAVPNIQLKGFEKVFIKAGQSIEVKLSLKVADLGLWNVRMKYVVEPGEFRISIGASSKDIRTKEILTMV
ncbi:glycoside hydrolase [Microthyrium microscopicum]|uniref:beta-glucosidase n=1 Tax=Microthyrium microscopicum TaxID=703497 RepID=A0A6A6U3Z6_9PEZI|nr:glycoside hydrolase [Microthyrium microscopicum]